MKLVHETLRRFVDAGQIAGCSIKIIRGGETLHKEYLGYANIEQQTPITEKTIFPIASMTKVITVAGIMRLYEQGLFKLWDPVSEYLPGFKNPTIAVEKPDGSYEIVPAKGEVTMRQLFTMTSGVPYAGKDTAAARIQIGRATNTWPHTAASCRTPGPIATWWGSCRWPSSRASGGCTASPSTCWAR